jgi:hypothetical protein
MGFLNYTIFPHPFIHVIYNCLPPQSIYHSWHRVLHITTNKPSRETKTAVRFAESCKLNSRLLEVLFQARIMI